MVKIKPNKKKIKTQIHENHFLRKTTQIDIIAIAAEQIFQFTFDYFDDEDVAFCSEYIRIVEKAKVYFKNFNEKMKKIADKGKYINGLSKDKYLFMLDSAIKLGAGRLKFNRDNARERADSNYYETMLASIHLIDALIFLVKEKEHEDIKNYFFAMKIQMRAICKIFEMEMGGVYGKKPIRTTNN